MKNILHNIIGFLLILVMMLTTIISIVYIYVDTSIDSQEYSEYHECVDFVSYMETDEFGDHYMKRMYYYSDGNVVTEIEY